MRYSIVLITLTIYIKHPLLHSLSQVINPFFSISSLLDPLFPYLNTNIKRSYMDINSTYMLYVLISKTIQRCNFIPEITPYTYGHSKAYFLDPFLKDHYPYYSFMTLSSIIMLNGSKSLL